MDDAVRSLHQRLEGLLTSVGASKPADHPWVTEARWLLDQLYVEDTETKTEHVVVKDYDGHDLPMEDLTPAELRDVIRLCLRRLSDHHEDEGEG